MCVAVCCNSAYPVKNRHRIHWIYIYIYNMYASTSFYTLPPLLHPLYAFSCTPTSTTSWSPHPHPQYILVIVRVLLTRTNTCQTGPILFPRIWRLWIEVETRLVCLVAEVGDHVPFHMGATAGVPTPLAVVFACISPLTSRTPCYPLPHTCQTGPILQGPLDRIEVDLTATHCNTLQHTATHCAPLQHTPK